MSEFSHLKNKLLAEQVEDQIYHYILDTPIEPGAKLPNEFELGEKFGVGRSTIREAIAGHDPMGAQSAMVMHLNFNRTYIKKVYDGEDPEDGAIGIAQFVK